MLIVGSRLVTGYRLCLVGLTRAADQRLGRVACQVSVRLRPRRPCGSASRCSIATSSPGESASTSSSGSPILLRPVGMGCGPAHAEPGPARGSPRRLLARQPGQLALPKRSDSPTGQVASQLSVFSQTRSYGTTAGNRRWNRACHVASLRRPTIVSLPWPESRLKQHRMLTVDLPGSRKPVTNQVATTPGNTRRSATRSETDICPACGNRT